MNIFYRDCGLPLRVSLLAIFLCSGVSLAQDYSSMGISDVMGSADQLLLDGNYSDAIPALKEVVTRTSLLTDPQGKEMAQTFRFRLAHAYYQTADVPAGMKLLDTYLLNEPRAKERMALRMMAQGFFDTQEWGKIEALAERLLKFPNLEPADIYNANLMLGQARFRMEKWAESIESLGFAVRHSRDERIKGMCQIMIVRALVEAGSWRELFGWIPRIYRTDSKYDITMNLTLMKAGKARFEAGSPEDLLNALLLYRMVLPREELLEFSNSRISKISNALEVDKKTGLTAADIESREKEINDIRESIKVLKELPAYEDEVSFRIGQIYAEVKRYWEGYVLFDKLYADDRTSEIGEASILQSILILYDVKEIERVEARILLYLDERADGQYARTLLSLMMRDNLMKQNYEKVVGLLPYVEGITPSQDKDEQFLQSELHYMLAFGYFQSQEFKKAGEQFSVIIDDFSNSSLFSDARYYRGMTHMLQADYENALTDFKVYQKDNPSGEHYSASLFREGVCYVGIEKIAESEASFTRFITMFPDNVLVSEAYSMRGDIEGAKEASNEDPHTLDRALSDYRKGIDKSTSSLQGSYAAFQAAKVYKLEYKWQEIIDLMNYYMARWEEESNVAEAVFWIGQSQIELDQVAAAVTAYLDAMMRFGNDTERLGVDKIIQELVKISSYHLSDDDREGLAVKLKLKLTNVDESMDVLRLRIRVAQVLLQGEDVAEAMGAELLESVVDLKITSPVSLALMCDAAVDIGDVEEMDRLSRYFIEQFEESDLLWHAYRAQTFKLMVEKDHWGVLNSIDEAQSMFGADTFMGWAQRIRADTQYKMGKYEEAEADYNMVLGVSEWRGPLFAEAMYGMGKCRVATGDLETAHSFFQRVYLLFKGYSDGDWAAKGYLAAADVLLKLDREEDAINTLKAMLEDPYTNENSMAEHVRQQLKKYGAQ